MVNPPIVTLSVPTSPEAEELSPYEIFHCEPVEALKVDDLEGSKIVWPEVLLIESDNSVDQT